MFIFTEELPTDKFIHSYKTGHLIKLKTIGVCEIKFSLANYNDLLFEKHSIDFPNTLCFAVAKRRAEFLGGRIAAQTLLRKEQNHENIKLSRMRIPIWPRGWIGSISHTDQYAIATLAPRNDKHSIGIDIVEYNPRVLDEIASMFINKNEQELLINSEVDYNIALHIVFSAKESLYKALYPQVNDFFGFESSIIIDINAQNQTFTLQLTNTLTPNLPTGYQHTGYYQLDMDKVITFIY
ncbi:4'-phosphopantetheinyl transferase superfamily protein [Salmonella enterica]|nr:4'-phosphopantetheinyl transferase superfamily protein [Salmonella enterica]